MRREWGRGVGNGNGVIRIMLADEQSLFRQAVRAVLESQGDFAVVGEARDGLQAVGEADRLRPDVALVDAHLPNGDGVRATRLIKQRIPDCRVLVLSNSEDQRLLLEVLEAGASGFLTKQCPVSELIEATRAVQQGETLVPRNMLSGLLDRLISRRREQDGAIQRLSILTRREREVLALLTEGADNDAIAQALVISPQTARTHIQNVLGKLGVHSRLEAAAFGRRDGVVQTLIDAGR